MKNEKDIQAAGPAQSKSKRFFPISGHWIAIGAFFAIFAVFVGFTLAFRRGDVGFGQAYTPVASLSKEEMAILVKDLNPMQQKSLAENADQRQRLGEEVRRILSLAREADREGLTDEKHVKTELGFINDAIVANNYDQKTQKSEGPEAQQFGSVTEEEVKAWWQAEDVEPGLLDPLGLNSETAESREQQFQDFIDAKLTIAREAGQMPEDAKPSDEELKMARGIFAKTKIMYGRAIEKLSSLSELSPKEKAEWKDFEKSTKLQIKLQQAQFLAQYYGQKILNKKLEIKDEDIEKYLAENPEFGDVGAKKARAEEVLKKLAEGADFAELAKEYSDDPGSKDNGGLYEDVRTGQMNKTFEEAALALEVGDYTRTPVQTDFGFHIIKLDSKNAASDGDGSDANAGTRYSVRHILISTQISDPQNPMRPMPPKEFARAKLRAEREKEVFDQILERNPVTVPTEFEIPEVSEEDIQKLMQQQRGIGPGSPPQPRPPVDNR